MGTDNQKTARKQCLQDPLQDPRLNTRAVIGEQVVAQEHDMKAPVRHGLEKVMVLPGNAFLEGLVDYKFVSLD